MLPLTDHRDYEECLSRGIVVDVPQRSSGCFRAEKASAGINPRRSVVSVEPILQRDREHVQQPGANGVRKVLSGQDAD